MGDCQLRIQVCRSLLKGSSTSSDDASFDTATRVWSSDTTIREVVEESLTTVEGRSFRILSLLEQQHARVWDSTSYPPKDVTDVPLKMYPEKIGLKSSTLFDAGWYPSGTLQVLPADQSPRVASALQYDDPQYNLVQDTVATQRPRVELLSSGEVNNGDLPLPSQVMASVTQRFDASDRQDEVRLKIAVLERIKNKESSLAKERERIQKLDRRIRKLEDAESSKNNKIVSAQVQRMLIKSRSTGRSDLKMQDRYYLRCIVDDGASTKVDYRFFSPQDTVARVLSSFSCPTGYMPELLIQQQSPACYRRLPVVWRIYELVSEGYLSEFDRVVVRWYDPALEEASTSVEKDNPEKDQPGKDSSESSMLSSPDSKEPATMISDENDKLEKVPSGASIVTNQRLFEAVRSLEAGSGKMNSKSSTAINRVRQMQMKSKANGDAKRVKMEERFFVELVTIVEEHSTSDAPTFKVDVSPVFIGKSDNFERLIRDCVTLPTGRSNLVVELFLPASLTEASFRPIEDRSMSLNSSAENNLVKSFDRLIVHIRPQ